MGAAGYQTQRFIMMILFLLFAVMAVSDAIKCFECSSVNDNYCPDQMSSDDEDIVELKNCGSSLYEAQYCVKTTGVEGGWGPQRKNSYLSNASSELHCYVCDETDSNGKDFGCSDPSLLGSTESCRNVFDAQYCIKAEGVWAGSLGTRRFCSSRDLGNYCDFIKRPGDQLEYRSCIYTCTGNGCNGASLVGGGGSSHKQIILITITTSVLAIMFPIFFAPRHFNH